jgi:dipeptidyl aminopeptidase/acylaminoacyl peptidase
MGRRASMPPVQIHHGTGDGMVDIAESEHLVHELRAAGKVKGLGYEFFRYPNQGHGFSGDALVSSCATAVAFLKTSL